MRILNQVEPVLQWCARPCDRPLLSPSIVELCGARAGKSPLEFTTQLCFVTHTHSPLNIRYTMSDDRFGSYDINAATDNINLKLRDALASSKYFSPRPAKPSLKTSTHIDVPSTLRETDNVSKKLPAEDCDLSQMLLNGSTEGVESGTPKRCRSISPQPLTPGSTPGGRTMKKPKRGYASPETYQHLQPLQDYLEPYLDGELQN